MPSGDGVVSSTGWGGREPPIRAPGKLPALLMHHPMMTAAHQSQIRQVGRATIQPMPQMMSLTPGQGPFTAREDTPAVANGQGGPLGGLDDPGGLANLQRLAGCPTYGRG